MVCADPVSVKKWGSALSVLKLFSLYNRPLKPSLQPWKRLVCMMLRRRACEHVTTCIHQCVASMSRSVYPHMCLHAWISSRTQRRGDEGSEAAVRPAAFCQCSTFNTSQQCLVVPVLPVEETVSLVSWGFYCLSASVEPHSKPASRSLLSPILFPVFRLIGPH